MKSLHNKYYDYSDFFKNNNSIDYWKDKTHLSKIGAELFSAELSKTHSLTN